MESNRTDCPDICNISMLPQKVDIVPADCVINVSPSFDQDDMNKKWQGEFTSNSRCPSHSSSIYSNAADICRICHCEGTTDAPLITPCYCSGSLRYVHQGCLQQWIKSSDIRCCELCKFQFIMQTKIKPFNEWEYLEMSGLERKKLLCAMLFHIIAMTCVCWSLYVLIDRTLDEVQRGHLDWPFWTKLMVVGIGFMGGIVFMYIQCKAYVILCQRWKAYNRVIYVQNAPEKVRNQMCSKPVIEENNERDLPGTSIKPYTTNACNKDINQNPSCIDIKGVRNLHIFFNEENRIRLHKPELPTSQSQYRDLGDGCSIHDFNEDKNNRSDNSASNSTSWHIEIGDSLRGNKPATIGESYYGNAVSPSDLQLKQKLDNDKEADRADNLEIPSIILQIKKAEIVIEFGQNTPETCDFSQNNLNSSESTKIIEPAPLMGSFSVAAIENGACCLKDNSDNKLNCNTRENNLNLRLKNYNDDCLDTSNDLPTSRLLKSYSAVNLNSSYDNKSNQALTDWNSNDNLLNISDPSQS